MLRAAVAMLLLASGTAAAQSADPLYPITSFLDPLQNTLKTVPAPNVGAYNFQAGMLGIITRAAERYPKILAMPQTQTQITNEIQATIDGALHLRPSLPYNPSGGDSGNADFMPDWNRNGRAFASEHVAAGSDESQCIRVPDRAILNQPPADFLAAFAENKHVCDCAGETDGRTCDTPPTFMP